jgi:Pyrimidine dimer DNA glycosylase/Protein of unknown function (DUF1722)
MRVWDVATGYLSRPSLLGEHRELHGLHSILIHGKKGYAHHPETLRWVGRLSALAWRHDALVAEMTLRGYLHRSPVDEATVRAKWPKTFVTEPGAQFELLRTKYAGRISGRIPLPGNAQQLWAQHKYSVMARDPALCRSLGQRVAARRADVSAFAAELVEILRRRPARGRLVNALEHMWGHVADAASAADRAAADADVCALLRTTQTLARKINEPYLMASTALSELAIFVDTLVP